MEQAQGINAAEGQVILSSGERVQLTEEQITKLYAVVIAKQVAQ